MYVSVLSCEHTCTMTQHYKEFQCFIITAMKTLGNKADIILSYSHSHVTELISECSAHCFICDVNLAGKCDPGQCENGFGPDAENTCNGKASRNYYYILHPHKQW